MPDVGDVPFLPTIESWNRHDVKAFAQLFASDADFVNIGGKHMKGRNEIESHHATIHEGHYRDSYLTANTLSLRFLRSDVAIAHVALEVVTTRAMRRGQLA